MKVEINDIHARSHAFWLFEYLLRSEGHKTIGRIELDKVRKSTPLLVGPFRVDADDRLYINSDELLNDMATHAFDPHPPAVVYRHARAVYELGPDTRKDFSFEWVDVHWEFPWDGKTACVIDWRKDIQVIQREIETLWIKNQAFDKSEGSDEIVNDFKSIEMHASNGSPIIRSNISRAVGLWLWDYVEELGGARGGIKRAIKQLETLGHIERLGLSDIEDSDLRFWRSRTDECIQAAEVLPFTKRKKGTQNTE